MKKWLSIKLNIIDRLYDLTCNLLDLLQGARDKAHKAWRAA